MENNFSLQNNLLILIKREKPTPELPLVIIDVESDRAQYPKGRTPGDGLIAPLNVGLSFTTSEYTSHFELYSLTYLEVLLFEYFLYP